MRARRGIWAGRAATCGLLALLAVPGAAAGQGLGQADSGQVPRTGSAAPHSNVPPMVIDGPTQRIEGVLPVMTLDQEALYLRSKWGKRANADLDKRRMEIATENDRLANQFAAEEQSLTVLRQTLPADEFRKRADEFDKRVVEVRRDREAAVAALATRDSEEQQAFFRAALPLLAALMQERGAVVVLDQRAIFVASQSIDVTDALIERIDRDIGAGPLPEAPGSGTAPQPAPAPTAPTTAAPAQE